MFDANNTTARSSMRQIRLKCAEARSKITLTSSRHQTHSKKEMSYAII